MKYAEVPRNRLFLLVFLIVGITHLPVQLSAEKPGESPERRLKIYFDGPQFKLSDSTGGTFDSSELLGQVWLANFFFTSCEGPCPIISAKLARLQQEFSEAHDLRFVSLSVDPERDSMERLAAFAGKYGANPARWHFLRTEGVEQVKELLNQGFHVGSAEKPVFHSTSLVLLDRKGRIRGYYSGVRDEDFARLRSDIRLLLDQP